MTMPSICSTSLLILADMSCKYNPIWSELLMISRLEDSKSEPELLLSVLNDIFYLSTSIELGSMSQDYASLTRF